MRVKKLLHLVCFQLAKLHLSLFSLSLAALRAIYYHELADAGSNVSGTAATYIYIPICSSWTFFYFLLAEVVHDEEAGNEIELIR